MKILAKDLENALAGLPLFVANSEDEVDVVRYVLKELQRCEVTIVIAVRIASNN